MIQSSIFYNALDNVWHVIIRIDAGDEYEYSIDAEACRTAGQALDAAMSML